MPSPSDPQTENLNDDFKRVFGTDHGERVLAHLQERFIMCSTWNTDLTGMAVQDGMRRVVLYMMQMSGELPDSIDQDSGPMDDYFKLIN